MSIVTIPLKDRYEVAPVTDPATGDLVYRLEVINGHGRKLIAESDTLEQISIAARRLFVDKCRGERPF